MSTEHSQPFLQVVICRARQGITDAEVLHVSAALSRWVAAKPGFVRRRLLSDGDGTWVDLVEWRDRAAADAAMAAGDHPNQEEMARVLAIESMTFVQASEVTLA